MPIKYAGIDCSTNSIAFGVIQAGQLVDYGEERFIGSTVFERNKNALLVTQALVNSGRLKVDLVVFEAAVFVKSVAVAIKMAYCFGPCMAAIQVGGARAIDVTPLTWQSGIGNNALNASEKAALKKLHPGKSASWYSGEGRKIRKQRTMDIVNTKYGINVTSDNISDSIGIAMYASEKLGK